MKLRRTEKVAIAVTVLIFAILVGYGVGSSTLEEGAFYVRTAKEAPTEAIMLGGDVTEESAVPSLSLPAAGKININTASEQELMELPGIGEVLAARIVTFREENGEFDSVDCIMDVSGIGEKLYEKIADLITVKGDGQ